MYTENGKHLKPGYTILKIEATSRSSLPEVFSEDRSVQGVLKAERKRVELADRVSFVLPMPIVFLKMLAHKTKCFVALAVGIIFQFPIVHNGFLKFAA